MHSESSEASETELFRERSQRLLVVHCFREESSSRMFEFRIRLWGILICFLILITILTCT